MGFLESLKKLCCKKEEVKKVETASQNPAATNTGNDTTGQNQGTL